MEKLVKKAGSVLDRRLNSLNVVVERRTRNMLQAVMGNFSHPLHHTLQHRGAAAADNLSHCTVGVRSDREDPLFPQPSGYRMPQLRAVAHYEF